MKIRMGIVTNMADDDANRCDEAHGTWENGETTRAHEGVPITVTAPTGTEPHYTYRLRDGSAHGGFRTFEEALGAAIDRIDNPA